MLFSLIFFFWGENFNISENYIISVKTARYYGISIFPFPTTYIYIYILYMYNFINIPTNISFFYQIIFLKRVSGVSSFIMDNLLDEVF
jgi:hypothetical protein